MTVGAQTAASRLIDIVGAANVTSDGAESAAYEIDGKRPSSVVRPGTAAEIAEILKFAASEGLASIPCGARTKLGIGLPPRKYDLALDVSRLNRIVAYDPGDLTLRVEAGAPLCQLQTALSEHKQFLPFAVPYFARSTVGGAVASGIDSPLRQAYGTARDFVLGMEFVTGDGIGTKSGGRVVKNVTGYDLHKLMIGSLGSLAVITKVNFRTFPQPISSRGFVANFPSSTAAFEMRNRLAASPLRPLTVEIFSPQVSRLFASEAAANIANTPLAANPLANGHWAFTTGFAGNDAVRARYESELNRMAKECGAASISILGDNLAPAWIRKRELIPIALASSPATIILKIGVVPARARQALEQAAKSAEESNLQWAAMARGVGVLYFALLPNPPTTIDNPASLERVTSACRRIASEVQGCGGNFFIPFCPSVCKSALADLIWGATPSDLAQMQKLKSVFDPRGILSPGRFVGGL